MKVRIIRIDILFHKNQAILEYIEFMKIKHC